ncbi:MAG TPA: iron-sulfur cluster assembly scaffold protein [Sphingomicrobium sp.]|jgi:NifU-like protein involved in Fe-S cluster formation
MNAPLYTTDVLRLAAALQGVRDLERVDGEGELRSPTCGSRIKLAVQLDSERRVQAISQEVHACAFGQASAALMETKAFGLSHADATNALVLLSRWLGQEHDDVSDWPGLEALAPARDRQARHGAILLPWRTLIAAMENCR